MYFLHEHPLQRSKPVKIVLTMLADLPTALYMSMVARLFGSLLSTMVADPILPPRAMDYRMSMMTNVMAYCSRASSWPRGCEKSHSSTGDARGHFKVRYSPNLTPSTILYPSAWPRPSLSVTAQGLPEGGRPR